MLKLLEDIAVGFIALILIIVFPILWLLSQILPYGLTCLFTGWRLKKEYSYFYFLPRFIKELTRPLRKKGNLDM